MKPRPAALTLVVAMAAAGCATERAPDAALQAARAAVRAAEADPSVSLFALAPLENAERQLQVAESAPTGTRRRAQAAYLATQSARVALIRAGVEADHAKLTAEQRERERIEFAERVPAAPVQ
jgi:hypothetical protein